MKAQATIWQRMQDALGTVNAETIHTGAFDLDAVEHMDDEDTIRALS